MASLVKTTAIAAAMRRCPFLSKETLSFALNSRSMSSLAKKCPVMSKLMAKVDFRDIHQKIKITVNRIRSRFVFNFSKLY